MTVVKSRFIFSLRMCLLLSGTEFVWAVIDNSIHVSIKIRRNKEVSLNSSDKKKVLRLRVLYIHLFLSLQFV